MIVAKALIASMALVAVAATQPDPGVEHVHAPGGVIFYTNPGGPTPYAGFASLFNADRTNADGTRTRRMLLHYKTTTDAVGTAGSVMKESADEGRTWQTMTIPQGTVNAFNMVRLADAAGTVLWVDFEPTSVTAPPGAPNQFRRWLLTSSGWQDGGLATVTFGQPIQWSRVQQAPVLLGDGRTLLVTLYGLDPAGASFVVVARSTNAGVTWAETSRIAGASFNEASIAVTTDGQLMVAMRREAGGGLLDLYVARSTNATGPWTTPTIVSSNSGASPLLRMLGNGVLVLGSGRYDNVLRFSMDGTGSSLLFRSVLYQNYPVESRRHGSSGYLGIAHLSANRFLVVGDNCAPGWGCPTNLTGYQVGRQNALWSSIVEADTAQWGKIDLQTKFQRGEIAVTTPLTSFGTGRASLAAYGFDGDPRPDSSVVSADRSITLRLDRPYELTGLGLHAHLGGAADVRIETSVDGASWTEPSRAARRGILRPFATPVTARYLRITDPSAAPDASFLHEIEAYTTTDGFENDYPGQGPRGNGLLSTQNVAVVNASSFPAVDRLSSRFLRINDLSNGSMARTVWRHAASTAATLEFKAQALGSQNQGLLFGFSGKSSTGADVWPYHMHLRPNGFVYRYDWASQSWGSPLNSTPIPVSSWNAMRLQATTTQATLFANGNMVATITPSTPSVSLHGNQLASSGTAPVGDDWLIDDLSYQTP